MKEKKSLRKKLAEFKEQSLAAKSNSETMLKNLRSELKSWEERRKVIEMQMKELWSAIQTQDDANVKLKLDAEEWIDRESEMKEELNLLRKALKNYNTKDQGDEYLYISSTTDDWKLSIERDLKHSEYGRNGPSVKSTHKLNRWQQKQLMKHVRHKKLSGVKTGSKLPLKGHCVKADISYRKCNRKIHGTCRPGKLEKSRFKKNRHQSLNEKVTVGQNIKS